MSRIGKKPVAAPAGVTASLEGKTLSVKGPKGTLSMSLADEVSYAVEDGQISVQPVNDSKRSRSFWGMQRTMVQNLIVGVTEGYTKTLQITGVGYRANVQGKNLKLQLGYSHDVIYPIPEGITVECPSQTEIVIKGADKQLVGLVAAKVRAYRPPEPYKGKGVRYANEKVSLKEAKKK